MAWGARGPSIARAALMVDAETMDGSTRRIPDFHEFAPETPQNRGLIENRLSPLIIGVGGALRGAAESRLWARDQ